MEAIAIILLCAFVAFASIRIYLDRKAITAKVDEHIAAVRADIAKITRK